jgi:hypothetical protein
MIRFCGQTLTKQETYLLLKKSKCGGENFTYKDFLEANTWNINDVHVDAYYLTHHLLDAFFGGQQKVKIEKLAGFFEHFGSYF